MNVSSTKSSNTHTNQICLRTFTRWRGCLPAGPVGAKLSGKNGRGLRVGGMNGPARRATLGLKLAFVHQSLTTPGGTLK